MKGNPKIRVRFIVCISAWFALLVLYIHRSNISLSILTMVAGSKSSKISPCIQNNSESGDKKTGQFDWTVSVGTLLGCFFYGYASMHFIGGALSAKVGPRITMGLTLFGSSLFQLLSVSFADKSVYAFIFARVMSGFFSGPIIPVIHEIVSVWSPIEEVTTLTVFTHTGNVFGLIVNYGVGGFIVNSNSRGWGYFFYFSGGLGMLALLLWLFAGFDSPDTHPYISDKEYEYITKRPRIKESKTENDDKEHEKNHSHLDLKEIPFVEILKSVPAWTCHFGQMASNFLLYGLLTGHPKFLKDVYGFNPIKCSLLSMFPFVTSFVCQMAYSRFVDYLIKNNKIGKTKIRKISSLIGFGFGGFFISLVGFVGCSYPYVAVFIVCLSMAAYSCNTSGYFTSIIDLAPKYAGVVMGMSNTLGSVSGILNPLIVDTIVTKSENFQIGWKYAFIATGLITFGTGLPYLLFGSSQLQPWAYHDLALLKDHNANKDNVEMKTTADAVDTIQTE